MTNMSEMVVSCIRKQSSERTSEEINNLLPWLRMTSRAFVDLKSEIIYEILKNCTFSEKKRDDVIMYQGEIGDCFYVILNGKVSIYVQTDADSLLTEDAHINASEHSTPGKVKKELDRSRFGNCVSQCDAGKSFGELALINENSIRNASIIADELTHLLVVNKELYSRSIKEIQVQEFNQRLNFVNRSEIFSSWFAKLKKQAAFSIRKEFFGYNMPLATQGEPTNGLIFLLKGQAKVVVNIHQHSYQYPRLNLLNNNEEMKILEINDLERSVDEFDSKKAFQNVSTRRLPYTEAEQRQAQRSIEISIVTNGEIIGDLEQGLGLSTYSQSIITIEPTEVYILDATNFERLMKRNPKTLKLLRTKSINKLRHREKWLESRPVPFYTKLNALIQELEERQAKEEQSQLELSKVPEKEDTLFMDHRGPLINMYGPGSVFYRNRQMRKEKLLTEKKKKFTQMAFKGQSVSHRSGNPMTNVYGIKVDDTVDEYTSDEDQDNIISMDKGTNLNQYKLPGNDEQHHDWETGSDHLHTLEKRLQDWYLSVKSLSLNTYPDSNRVTDQYTVLKRFKPDNKDRKIIPGKKIFLRPKIPSNIPKTMIQRANIEDCSRDKVFITARRFKSSSLSKKSTEEFQENIPEFKDGLTQSLPVLQRDPFNFSEQKGQRKMKTDEPLLTDYEIAIKKYKGLKQLLKEREIDMRNFQTAMSI